MKTDEDIKSILKSAGVPTRFREKDVTLGSLLPPKVARWATESIRDYDGNIILEDHTGNGTDIMYMLIRAACLKGRRAKVIYLQDVFFALGQGEFWRPPEGHENMMIALTVFSSLQYDPDPNVALMDSILRRMLDAGTRLILHVDGNPAESKWWGPSLWGKIMREHRTVQV